MTYKALELGTGKVIAVGEHKSDVFRHLQASHPSLQKTHSRPDKGASNHLYDFPLKIIQDRMSPEDVALIRYTNLKHPELLEK